jgi:flagellar basal-body rod modification protein FlgD
MTPISSSGASGEAAAGLLATPTAGNRALLDPNAFLKLLVAELQYQDPTKPMDTTQLVQQLTSMSQVEQAAQSNAKLGRIMDQIAIGQTPALIGMTVISADHDVSGTIASIEITAEGTLAHLAQGGSLLLSQGVTLTP